LKRIGRLLAILVVVITLTPPAAAAMQKKYALLIGNEAYAPEVGPLKNPHNDIGLVGKALESVGFAVTTHKDLGYREMNVVVRRHIETLREAGAGAIGFFYYSGHSAADQRIPPKNYLIPVELEHSRVMGGFGRVARRYE